MFTTLALVMCFGGKAPNCAPCDAPRMMPPQYPMGPDINAGKPCPPLGPAAGVLAVKVVAPDGTRITALPGSPMAKTFTSSALFGLRPGYVYRFELASPIATLYPVVEVRGSLYLRPSMTLMEHFAAINYSERDLERAAAGALITKVIYLEDPEKAVPVRTTADKPLEIPEDNEELAIKAALENGRLVMIVRLGNRKPTANELAAFAVANTVLMPGEQHLGQPSSPPTLGWQGVALFDPILGPKFPSEECFTDGGDKFPLLGVRDDGRLGGLTPTDTSAQFRVGIQNRVTTSNTVCICAPRFVVQRAEQGIIGVATTAKPQGEALRQPPAVARQKTPPAIVILKEKPLAVVEMIHPQIQSGLQKPQGYESRVGLKAIYELAGVKQITGVIEPEEVQNSDDFLLIKDVEPKSNVKVGDVVTFTLTYKNRTNKPVTDLVVSDSLSGRLEYVPGSTQSDRPTNVTLNQNEAGSVIVRFELPGTLQPGQGGVVKFQARVR